jgi:tripeptide aminopeptidase
MVNKRLIDVFLDLALIDGISGKERRVADYIASFLANLGLSPFEDDSNKSNDGEAGNIICKIGDGGNFAMLAHMDTARPTKDLKPIVLDDRITSDGNTILGADNREGIAILLYTIENIIKSGIPSKSFTLAFMNSEETNLNGSLKIKFDKNIKKSFVFDLSYRPGSFIYKTPGAVSYKVKIFGIASHSGVAPEKGVNSIKIASDAISKLPLGRLDDESTANIGIINGGSAINVIPELTVVEGEVRSFDQEKVMKNIQLIQNEFEKAAQALNGRIEFEYNWDFKPYEIKSDEEVFRDISQAIRNVGLEPKAAITFGGSDANSLNEKGIPSVDIGIGAQNPHSNNEFVLLEDLEKSAEIAFQLMKK